MQIPYALLTLSAVFGFVVAWCLNQIWKLTFGAFFNWLGNLGLSISIPHLSGVTIHPFGFLLKFNNDAQAFFSGMVATAEHAMVRLFHQTISSFGNLASELGALAQALERRIAGIVGAVVPAALRAARGLLGSALKRLHGLQLSVQHLLGRIEKGVARAIATAAHIALKALLKAAHELRHLGVNALKKLMHFGRRLGYLEQQLVGKNLLRLIHKALRELKLGWLFALNVERFGQWLLLQGVPEVYEFVKDAVVVLSETDMCKLAAYNYDVAVYVFEPVMEQLVGVGDWFCRHEGESLASAMDLHPGYAEAWAPSATPPITGPFLPRRLAPDVPLPRGVVRA